RPCHRRAESIGDDWTTSESERPRASLGALSYRRYVGRSESIVQPAAHDVGRERRMVVGEPVAGKAAIDVAQAAERILALGGRAAEQQERDPGADGPAEIGLVLARQPW